MLETCIVVLIAIIAFPSFN